MLNKYMAAVYLEDELQMGELTKIRNIGSIPIGGRYRVIDFALSNLINSGVKNIGIFSSEEVGPSLRDHIGGGEHWDLDRKKDGIFFFNASFSEGKMADIKIFERNLEYFLKSTQEHIIVLNPNVICNIDLKIPLEEYEKKEIDILVLTKKDKLGELKEKENKYLDIFIMKKNLFLKMLIERIQNGTYLGVRSEIFKNLKKYKVETWEFDGYVKNINSIKNYYEFNMDILNKDIRKEIFCGERKIYTKVKDTPSTNYGENSQVINSLIANGCNIQGEIKNSILGRRVTVEKGAKVENAIIFQDCIIKKDAKLKNIILDKNNLVEEKEEIIGVENSPLVIGKNFYGYLEKIKKFLD